MGGHSPSSDSGSADAPNTKRSQVTKVRGEGGLVDFIKGGGVTGAIVRGVVNTVKNIGTGNKTSKSGDVYGGKTSYGYNEAKEKIDYNPTSTLANRGGNDRPSQKSVEQPKVAAQMDNSDVKSDLVNADVTSPTYVEMNQEEDLLTRKKRGRKQTILTSVTGDTTKPQLSKKTLLG
jgi:phage tail tape-measure protein